VPKNGRVIAISSVASFALELASSFLAPPRCAACDVRVSMLAAFCAQCARTAEGAPCDNPQELAAFAYGGAISSAIGRFKYDPRPDLARPLGDLLWRAIERHARELSGAVVVPVPLHRARLAERGFNQSALLAHRVSRRLGAPLRPALARVRDTPQQTTLDKEARIANVAGAFRVRRPSYVEGLAVLVIDDVCTTGATLAECARVLRQAGARSVTSAVVARTSGIGGQRPA
jgi:ComF family protein